MTKKEQALLNRYEFWKNSEVQADSKEDEKLLRSITRNVEGAQTSCGTDCCTGAEG